MSNTFRRDVVVALALLLLSGALRVHGVGKWAFSWDEPYTLIEQAYFFGSPEVDDWQRLPLVAENMADESNQWNRLPRIVPLGYVPTYLGTQIFGQSEFGARIVVALLGALQPFLCYLILRRSDDPAFAFPLGFLIAIWPRHIFVSQLTRMYLPCSLFAFCAILFAYRYATDKEPTKSQLVWSAILCLFAAACHTLAAGLLLWLPLLIFVGRGVSGLTRANVRDVLLIFGVAFVAFLACYAFYLRPMLHGWNSHWAKMGLPTIFAGMVRRYEPTIMALAGIGVLYSIPSLVSSAKSRFIAAGCVTFFVATAVLAVAIPFHPIYMFSFALFVPLAATYAMVEFVRRNNVRVTDRLLLGGLLFVPIFFSLASHYQDGSRQDVRPALAYIGGHRIEGDLVSVNPVYQHLYAKRLEAAGNERNSRRRDFPCEWIIEETNWRGLTPGRQTELEREGYELEFSYARPRFDLARYGVHVFRRPLSAAEE